MDRPIFRAIRNYLFFFTSLIIGSLGLAGCQKIPFLQQNKTGGLQIHTESVTASVFLNGEFVNKTPYIDQNLKTGTYSVKIEPEDTNLVSYETSITVYPDTLAVVNWTPGSSVEESGGVIFELEPLSRNNSALSVTSIPDSTIVNIDGESKGFAPVLVEDISAGDHDIKISLPSYTAQEHSLNIVEGMKMHLLVKLAKVKTATESALLLEASDEAESTESAESSSSAKPTSSPTPVAATTTEKPYVEILDTPTGWLRVRAEASVDSDEVAKVDVGATFSYLDSEDGWYQIKYAEGETGWISGEYAELVEE